MKKQNNISRLLIMITFLGIGFAFGFTMMKDSKNKTDVIKSILKETCNCEEVNQLIYAKGIQFGKEGVTTEKAEYQLINCDYLTSEKELQKLNRKLIKEVKNFEDIDYLELEFIKGKNSKTIIIKNGKINQ